MPHSLNHRTTESFSQVESGSTVPDTCDVTGECDTLVICDCDSLPQVSQPVTSDIVTYNITHDCDL